MISYEPGDFLIVETPKKVLVKANTFDPDNGRAVIESTLVAGDPEYIEFEQAKIVSNLGPRPAIGSVHGVKVEPWVKSFDTVIGDCDVYFNPNEPKLFRLSVVKAANKMLELLEEWGLADLVPVQLEMRFAKGKKATGFHHTAAGRGELDIVMCRPQDQHTMEYIIIHEFGHAIWSHKLRSKVKAKWVEKYHTGVEVTEVAGEDCSRLLDYMLEIDDSMPSDFAGQLDEDDVGPFRTILGWIETHHGLRPQDLDILRTVGNNDKIIEVWPESVTMSDMEVIITEYAKKNCEELWCDSLAHYCTGVVPDDIKSMVEKTLASVKGSRK